IHILSAANHSQLRLKRDLGSGASDLDMGTFHRQHLPRRRRPSSAACLPGITRSNRATRTEPRSPARSHRIRRESTLPRGGPGGDAMARQPSKGLADVVAAATALSDIDGRIGRLSYRGYDINQLVGTATFEEIAYLLQRGAPPTADELASYHAEIVAGRQLGTLVTDDLAPIAHHQEPMEALRTLVSLASASDPDKDSNRADANLRKATRLTAQQPVLVAAYEAARNGRQPPQPDSRLGLAGNFLFQLSGRRPSERSAEILDICL